MGNTESQNSYESAAQELALQFADWREQEEHLKSALKESIRAGDSTASAETKDLTKEMVRVRALINGLFKGIDKERTKLQDEERRLVNIIQNENGRGETINDRLAMDLVRARKNIQDFGAAFAELQGSFERWTQVLEIQKQESLVRKKQQVKSELPFIATIQRAIEHDNNREYEKALSLYLESSRQINEALLTLEHEGKRQLLIERLAGYDKRAQELQKYLASRVRTEQQLPFIDTICNTTQKAIEHDNNREYEKALSLYLESSRQINQALLTLEHTEGQRQLLTERLAVYDKRAQELQKYLESVTVSKEGFDTKQQ